MKLMTCVPMNDQSGCYIRILILNIQKSVIFKKFAHTGCNNIFTEQLPTTLYFYTEPYIFLAFSDTVTAAHFA